MSLSSIMELFLVSCLKRASKSVFFIGIQEATEHKRNVTGQGGEGNRV